MCICAYLNSIVQEQTDVEPEEQSPLTKIVFMSLIIADRTFRSRLLIGTGKYRSFQEMARCHAASGAEVVTVAVRRVNLTDRSKESLLDYIDRSKMFILPNTAVCYTGEDAVRMEGRARGVGHSNRGK